MSPEQAQGLETLDSRADVFALAAVTYEAVTGSVPFSGNNGPSILLSIMTKDPIPPSIKGKDLANPPPPGLDDVLDHALAKNQNIRTGSVGEFADAVGRAYGLEGDHHAWATMPQAELAKLVAEAKPRVMARAAAVETAADPFAVGDPFAAPAPAGDSRQAAMNMDRAFAAARGNEDAIALGTPQRRGWLVPVLVGLAALLVGGAAAAAIMMAK
jgi:serine/threonine-protein kinase